MGRGWNRAKAGASLSMPQSGPGALQVCPAFATAGSACSPGFIYEQAQMPTQNLLYVRRVCQAVGRAGDVPRQGEGFGCRKPPEARRRIEKRTREGLLEKSAFKACTYEILKHERTSKQHGRTSKTGCSEEEGRHKRSNTVGSCYMKCPLLS